MCKAAPPGGSADSVFKWPRLCHCHKTIMLGSRDTAMKINALCLVLLTVCSLHHRLYCSSCVD